MFIGDFEQGASWMEEGVQGCRKFLDRVWRMQELVIDEEEYSEELEVLMHQTIKKVTEDYENLKFNTAIAQLMSLSNEIRSIGKLSRKDYQTFLLLFNPVAPHITEEIWERMEFQGRISKDGIWPTYDEKKLEGDSIELPVQVNGKVRGTILIPVAANKDEVLELARKDSNVNKHLENKEIKKLIYIDKKILNIVVK